MPFLRRTFAPAGLDAHLSNRSWLHPLARLSAIESRGFVWNPTAGNLPVPADDGRVYVHLVVAGCAIDLKSGALLGPGDALVTCSFRDTFEGRPLAFRGAHRALALRLDPRLAPRAEGVLRLPAERVRALHARLASATSEPVAQQILPETLALVRAAGLTLGAASIEGSLSLPPARARDAEVADSLSRALSVVQRPMWVDVAESDSPPSERHLRRVLNDFLGRFHMPFSTWRDLRQSFCLTTAALTMTVPGIKTEAVSQLTGFSSPAALCHAFHRAALHSPQQIAKSAQGLGRAL
ncbi:MAG: hypothetical protein IPM79_12885 [Polyangiaceae bacterium]|nr:hypothetical protein [Polyangiaceae bacterium]